MITLPTQFTTYNRAPDNLLQVLMERLIKKMTIKKKQMSSNQQLTLDTWAALQIWLHHKGLGHPLFGLLKSLFPHLFTKESVKSINCDIC
uniref:GAG-pre-integrase domain-containing protein n=1 Tax=Cajanus cajan TaxID=3821 RepID=A0A151TB42_CAJCA|nr:hypothetical protein KK1_018861 [Cajanus cajan]